MTKSRKRPHPAHRARLITGIASTAGVLGMTGYLAASSLATTTEAAATTPATTLTTTATKSTTAATASTPSSTASTTSRGS